MKNIVVGRYSHPETHGYSGWVEDEDRSWIVFVQVGGQVEAYLNRDGSGGVGEGSDLKPMPAGSKCSIREFTIAEEGVESWVGGPDRPSTDELPGDRFYKGE